MSTKTRDTLDVKLLRNLIFWAVGEKERLNKKYAFLTDYEWDQTNWGKLEKNGACKTSFCIAGAAVISNGYKFVWDGYPVRMANGSMNEFAETCEDKKGVVHDVQDVAADLLGITCDESDSLFEGDNNIEDIIRVSQDIARSRGVQVFTAKDLPMIAEHVEDNTDLAVIVRDILL